ncbi:hypothetical protein MXAN_2943 [Myxococcus xanthus DK 1622]|uniref:Uncharacterized protein n=1 Tax=Myxococcus xanthus (strain DK1622) TaxID=246197 RepID=Q1D871_MYXXD|nr:hypothetical protein MXAN_2943 [Myxococcus xanthus DK 1622]
MLGQPARQRGEPRAQRPPLVSRGRQARRAQLLRAKRQMARHPLQQDGREARPRDEDGFAALTQRAEAPQRQAPTIRKAHRVGALSLRAFGARVAHEPSSNEEVPLRAEDIPPEAPHGDVEQPVSIASKLTGKHGGHGMAGHGRYLLSARGLLRRGAAAHGAGAEERGRVHWASALLAQHRVDGAHQLSAHAGRQWQVSQRGLKLLGADAPAALRLADGQRLVALALRVLVTATGAPLLQEGSTLGAVGLELARQAEELLGGDVLVRQELLEGTHGLLSSGNEGPALEHRPPGERARGPGTASVLVAVVAVRLLDEHAESRHGRGAEGQVVRAHRERHDVAALDVGAALGAAGALLDFHRLTAGGGDGKGHVRVGVDDVVGGLARGEGHHALIPFRAAHQGDVVAAVVRANLGGRVVGPHVGDDGGGGPLLEVLARLGVDALFFGMVVAAAGGDERGGQQERGKELLRHGATPRDWTAGVPRPRASNGHRQDMEGPPRVRGNGRGVHGARNTGAVRQLSRRGHKAAMTHSPRGADGVCLALADGQPHTARQAV